MKVSHGEYGAFLTKGSIRFQRNHLMVKESSVPPEVRMLLKKKLGIKEENIVPPTTGKFPRPSEEELARMRAESVQVKPELQLTPEEAAQRAISGIPDNEAPLSPEDFLDEEPMDLVQTEPSNPMEQPDVMPHPSEVSADFLESVSIHSAPLSEIAQALYDRFGIYTVYLNAMPRSDEINPLTGFTFTKYHLGIAYQAALQAHNKGLPTDPEGLRQTMDTNRAASQNFQESFQPAPVTLGDARRQNSFAFRTNVAGTRPIPTTEIVHETDPNTGQVRAVQREIPAAERQGSGAVSRYNAEEETMLVEPPIVGAKRIIRPDW